MSSLLTKRLINGEKWGNPKKNVTSSETNRILMDSWLLPGKYFLEFRLFF
jgi:hypothetical protein